MDALEAFRQDTRAWLALNCPEEMRRPLQSDDEICWGGRHWTFGSDAQRQWLERMVARGWTVPTWPEEYGGAALSRAEAKILDEELAAIGARPPLYSFGIFMLGPALLHFGTDAQKSEHLPRIARGEVRWCQGYSEPGSGSDLASLQTRAEDAGDDFLVTGSKIWTSYADKADMMFCLVRTDTKVPKHLGISFILLDMEWKGVSTKPITLISGKSPFCETFLDGVHVPQRNLVGERNRGWDIAKYLLTHEREMIGATGTDLLRARPLGQLAAETVGLDATGRLDEPQLRADAARFEVDSLAFAWTMNRFRDEAAATGVGVGDRSSMLKYCGTELKKRRFELLMRASGLDALEWEGARSHDGKLARDWLRTKGNSIEGGTSEVMLEIVSKRLLKLPSM